MRSNDSSAMVRPRDRALSRVRLCARAWPWSGVALALGLLGAYLFVGDWTPLGEWLTVWPPLMWGVALCVWSLIAAMAGSRRAALSTVALALVLAGGFTEWRSLYRAEDARLRRRFEDARHGERSTSSALRVVTWNVSGGAPLDRIERLHPDLCLFQEVGDIRSALGRSPAWRGYDWVGAVDPGTLSRYRLQPLPSGSLGPWQPPQLFLIELPSGRKVIVVNARLMLPSPVVALASFGAGLELENAHATRLEQYRRLETLIVGAARRTGAGSVVLAGDFNVPARMQSLRPLRALLRDVWTVGGLGWGGTMTADLPVARIDQCWVSHDVEVVSARVLNPGGSDHRLLLVDLLIG